MRPGFRSKPGPNAERDGRPVELVRVRRTQRQSGDEGFQVKARARRRGGRGRRRGGRNAPPPPPKHRSFFGWLKSLFGLPRKAPRAERGGERRGERHGERREGALEQQEARVLAEFMKQYGIQFRDPGLLKLALTHRSYLSVTGQGPRESNERLEFLGDSVLGLVTSEYLYRRHPDEHEGQLTKTKSLLVSKAILSRRALRMGLGRYVLLSHSEVESGGRQRLSILADAFESVLGAVYLDQGFEVARKFIHQWLLAESDAIVSDKRHTNYKSHLQEYVQSTYRTHPVYRIRSEYGPDHSKHFMVEVMVGRRTLGEGRGHNKKEAEQAAARDAIERVEKLRRDARAPESRGPEEAAADEESEAGEGRRRRRGRRSRGRDRDHEAAPAAAGAAAEEPAEPWDEPEAPAEAEDFDATDDEEVVEVFDDDLDEGDEREEHEADTRHAPAPHAAGEDEDAGSPPHDEARLDPFGIEDEGESGTRSVVDVPAEPDAEEEEPGETDLQREARIEEIERAMASFGRQREHYGSAQRYGRKGRRGR